MVTLSLVLWVSLSSCSNLPAAQNSPKNAHEPQPHASIVVPEAEAEHSAAAAAEKISEPEHSKSGQSDSEQSGKAPEPERSAEISDPAHSSAESSEKNAEAAHAETESGERAASPHESSESDESGESGEAAESSTLASLIEDLKTKVMLESGIPTTDLLVQEAEAVEWNDSCLDLPQSDEMCAQVITSGYRIVLSNLTETFEFHTDRTGRLVRQVQPEKP